jgi:hypothetical protein
MSPAVDAVRTRMAVDIYGPQAAFLTFVGPVFPVRTRNIFDPQKSRTAADLDQAESPGADTDDSYIDPDESPVQQSQTGFVGEGGARFDRDPYDQYEDENRSRDFINHEIRLQFGRYAPVTIDNEVDTVPWETWTYTQINGGMEVTFTDEMGNGVYAFAPLPDGQFEDAESIRYIARMTEHSPEVIMQQAVSESPDYYRPGAFGPALNFYYDLAAFRGNDGQTRLEIYYGIPPSQVELEEEGQASLMHVKLAVAMADESHTMVYRNAQEFVYKGAAAADLQGTFVPELMATQVPPGKYELQVQIRDMISGRTGLYKQAVDVSDYRPEGLNISDIEMASSFGRQGPDKFKKGEYWIVPMPTRTYNENQKVYAYYEIYNLQRDQFGQTRYKTQYLVRSSAMPSVGVFGAVSSGLKTLLKSRKPQFSVETEHTGNDPTETEYIEIDLEKAKPGVNALEVRIRDLVANTEVSREVKFRYGQ